MAEMSEYKVHFIGSGWESIKHVIVLASTPRMAIERAEHLYHIKGWTFPYLEMEVDRCL